MATRTWEINLEGKPHTIRILHGTISGKQELWVDDQLMVTKRSLINYGFYHVFSIEGHFCEVGITTNGLTFFDYYLLVDQQLIEHPKTGRQSRRIIRSALAENTYWQALEKELGLSYFPKSGEIGRWQRRLVGRLNGYLIAVQYVEMSQARQGMICVHVRCAPLANFKATEREIRQSEILKPLLRALLAKNGLILNIQINGIEIILPYRPTKETAIETATKIRMILSEVSRFIRPTPEHICEGPDCKMKFGQPLQLVLVNGVPQFLCPGCITEIPATLKRVQAEYDRAPSGLLKGTLVGLLVVILTGFLSTLVWRFSGQIATLILIMLPAILVIVMKKVGAKRSHILFLVAGFLGVLGIIFGIFLNTLQHLIEKHAAVFSLADFLTAWRLTFQPPRSWIGSVVVSLLYFATFWFSFWMGQRRYNSMIKNPRIEVMKDVL
ncbi:MAG TPA: hypothetical protein PKM21_04350 [Anaerolineales bacterium]|nr:hypothetical protein [Anaerolineales bacterium]